MRALKEIHNQLRIIEEALGIVYDDEGIFSEDTIRELKRREREGTFLDEEDFWRSLKGDLED